MPNVLGTTFKDVLHLWSSTRSYWPTSLIVGKKALWVTLLSRHVDLVTQFQRQKPNSPIHHVYRPFAPFSVQDWSLRCPSNTIWPFKIYHTSLIRKQPFKTQPIIENEDVTWSPQYRLSTTRTNKRRALLSLQEVELYGWFFISSRCTWNMYHVIHAQV